MEKQDDLSPPIKEKIRRLMASGKRMERMIEQILDMTRARLAEGIPVALTEGERDVVQVVRKIADETQAAHPDRVIKIHVEAACEARIDPDRLEQVVSNLLSNALSHGAPDKPITVGLTSNDRAVKISVHNFGEPIRPDFLPHV